MKLLFPSVIHEVSIPNYKSIKDDLMRFVYQERAKDPKGVKFSNMGGWQSQPTYNTDENILIKTISAALIPYFSDNVFDMRKGIRYEGLWININKRGDYNMAHDHPCCHMAGVFWINTPKNSGTLNFRSPHSFDAGMEMMMYTKKFKDKSMAYPDYGALPREGTILTFPSSLMHMVTTSESDEDRISASFNLGFSFPEGSHPEITQQNQR